MTTTTPRAQAIADAQLKIARAQQEERDAALIRQDYEHQLGALIVGVNPGDRIRWSSNAKLDRWFEGTVTAVQPNRDKATMQSPGDFTICATGLIHYPDGRTSAVGTTFARRPGDAEFTVLTPEAACDTAS